MHRLFAWAHDRRWNAAMKSFGSPEMMEPRGRSFASELVERFAADPLEVNVIFTDFETTAAALKAAEAFARDLGARIRLRAGLVVPFQLPIDQPLMSVEFLQNLLRSLVGRSEPDGLERSIHLYLCRNWTDSLLEILNYDSVIVIGLRKRWWPTAASRLVHILRANRNRVIVVDPNGQQKESRNRAARGCNSIAVAEVRVELSDGRLKESGRSLTR